MDLDSVLLGRAQALILVVDDDEDNLVLIMQIVTQFDCATITAKTGQETLALARAYLPDLILLDILLPDINGLTVIQQVRQTAATTTIPIIAITALATTEDRDRLLAAGANDYLSKPYNIEDLEALIRAYLP